MIRKHAVVRTHQHGLFYYLLEGGAWVSYNKLNILEARKFPGETQVEQEDAVIAYMRETFGSAFPFPYEVQFVD